MKRAYEKSRQTEITQSENSLEITQQEPEVIAQSTSSEKPFKDIINNSVPAAEQKPDISTGTIVHTPQHPVLVLKSTPSRIERSLPLYDNSVTPVPTDETGIVKIRHDIKHDDELGLKIEEIDVSPALEEEDPIRELLNLSEQFFNEGNSFFKLGQYIEALSSYDEAVTINPEYADAYFNLGTVQCNLGRYADAVASFDRMNEINPDDAVAWYYRGNALNNLGQYTEAICSYDKAVAIKPDYAMARTKRRDVQRNLGQHIETESSSDKTIIVKPDVPKVKDTHEKNLNVLDELHPLPENREREGSLFLDQNKLKQKSLSMEKGHILPVENTKLRFLSQYKVSAPPPKTKIIRKYGAISRKKYIFPILEYLVLNNGTITTDIADDIIGSRFAKDFTSIDYEFHKDGTRRWEKNVDYATYIMKSNGLLKQDTLSEYKITEYGRQCYLKLKENPLTVINISNNKLTFYSP